MYIKICKWCENEICVEKQCLFASHVASCDKNTDRLNRKSTKKPRFEYVINCKKCYNDFTITLTEYNYLHNNYSSYCGYSCRNGRPKTEEQKNKLSIIAKNSENVKKANIQNGLNRRLPINEKSITKKRITRKSEKKRRNIKNKYSKNYDINKYCYIKIDNNWYKYYNDNKILNKIYVELAENILKISTLASCELCKKDIYHQNYKNIRFHHKCWLSISGGIKSGSSTGIKGIYMGYKCDSSYELAFIYYCLEHNINIERNTKYFEYLFENKIRKFYPDFIVNGEYVEIKNYRSDITYAKISQFPHNIKIYYKEDMKFYLDYIINKIGNKFTSVLYEDKPIYKNTKKDICKCGKEKERKAKQCMSCYQIEHSNKNKHI